MSIRQIRDHFRTALSGQSAIERAQSEATRAWLKSRWEEDVRQLEEKLRMFDHYQDPANNLNVDNRPSVHRYRAKLVEDLEDARHELRELN